MKKIILITLTLLCAATLFGCEETNNDNFDDSELTPEAITKLLEEALSNVEIDEEVEENFELLEEVNEVQLSYESNNNSIKITDDEAVVIQGFYDQNVVITVTASYANETKQEKHNVVVLTHGKEDATTQMLNEIELVNEVDTNFELPMKVHDVDIKWESNSNLININNNIAEVSSVEYNTNVILTATIKYDIFTSSKSFNVKVLGANGNQYDFENIFQKINISSITTKSFELIKEFNGYEISYQSSNDSIQIVDNEAIVTRSPIDINVILLVTIQKENFQITVAYNTIVTGLSNPIPGILANLIIPTEVDSDFELTTLIDDVNIEYISNDNNLIINNNVAIVYQTYKNNKVSILINAENEYYFGSLVVEVTILAKKFDVNNYINDNNEMIQNLNQMYFEQDYFLRETTGSTKGTYLFGIKDIEQTIHNQFFKYKDTSFAYSTSLKVAGPADTTIYHGAYYTNGNVSYIHSKSDEINSSDKAVKTTEDEYQSQYGILSNSINFTGYLMNDDTILESSYELNDKNQHVFYYKLNNQTSSNNMVKQMIAFGGIDSITFKTIEIRFVFDQESQLVNYSNYEVYDTVAYKITTTMTQNLTTTITKYNDISGMQEVPSYYL